MKTITVSDDELYNQKVTVTENQEKVIKDKYLKNSPSTEAWLRLICKNIALAELLYDTSVERSRIFHEVRHSIQKVETAPGQTSELMLLHHNILGYKERHLNFKRFMKNLYDLADENTSGAQRVAKTEAKFYRLLSNWEFLPNSPTLMNAGRELQQLSACYVLPVPDSIEGIYGAVKNMAIIHKSGGGTGFSFSSLRPENDDVLSTHGIASGPLSFMNLFDVSTYVVRQGGTRRGANMGIMRYDHPDILKFIDAKKKPGVLENFNVSVTVDETFMNAVRNNTEYDLINPHTQTATGKLNAKEIFNKMVQGAWETGDPGIIFIDRINNSPANPTPHLGQIESTNPCVTGDTRISTDRGLIPIQELTSETPIYVDVRTTQDQSGCLVQEQVGIMLSQAAQVIETGMKETYLLETESGYEIQATADHKLLTPNGWKTVAELTTEDSVLLQSGQGNFPNQAKLPTSFNNINTWSRELGQITGWLIGDGWIRQGKDARVGFCFGPEDLPILNHLKTTLNQLYGKEVREVTRERGVIHLSYHSPRFVEFFQSLDVKIATAESKEVPASIYTASREAVQGFLQALFTADGTIGLSPNKTRYVRLTSKSKKLLKGTQLLLLNLGIKSKIYDRSRASREVFSYTNRAGITKRYRSDGILYELQISKNTVPLFLTQIGFMNGKHAEKIQELENASFYTTRFEDKVASVRPAGIQKVYDLTEPATHSFIGNGIVLHNCGEQPLLPYEPCNLGSINLSKFVDEEKRDFDWERLRECVFTSVHFLDNVITVNNYPLPEIEEISKGNRRIGLGVMGWAESLVQMKLPYNSPQAFQKAEQAMKFVNDAAMDASEWLAQDRGIFPNFKNSIFDKNGKYFREEERKPRNCARTTIAPTGTIAITAGLQGSGIEPFFAIVYVRYNAAGVDALKDGTKPKEKDTFYEINPYFKKVAEQHNYFGMKPAELWNKIEANHKAVVGIPEIPVEIQQLFQTSHDLGPLDHVRIQAAFQKYTDNAVSKTVNMKNEATSKDVEDVYMLAYKLNCKGVTVYRDGSKSVQVLNLKEKKNEEPKGVQEIRHERQNSGIGESSTYYEIPTGYGPLHVHINYDEFGPTKIFSNISPSGTEISGLTCSLAILLSKYLSLGGDPVNILKHLNSIKGDKPYGFGQKRVDSIPHAISKALRDHLIKTGKLKDTQGQQVLDIKQQPLPTFNPAPALSLENPNDVQVSLYCPKCYSSNVEMLSGCTGPTCFDCGHSECS